MKQATGDALCHLELGKNDEFTFEINYSNVYECQTENEQIRRRWIHELWDNVFFFVMPVTVWINAYNLNNWITRIYFHTKTKLSVYIS